MNEPVSFGVGHVFTVPVLSQTDTRLFKTTPTVAAGDAKLKTNGQAFTNLTAKLRAFTSGGTAIPVTGETVTGATSAATGIVVGYVLTSGTFAGGDAAGSLFIEQQSGTFQSENLNGSVGGANILTIGGDFTVALMADAGQGNLAVPLTSVEAQTDFGQIALIDATGAEWCNDQINFVTTDHPSAGDPKGCIAAAAGHASSQTATNVRLNVAPQSTIIPGVFVVARTPGSAPMYGVVKSYSTAGGQFNITLYDGMPAAITSAWTVYVYGDAAVGVSRVVASENIDYTALQLASLLTQLATGLETYDAPTHAELTSELALADDAMLALLATASAYGDLTTSVAGGVLTLKRADNSVALTITPWPPA